MPRLDATHDPARRSWVESANAQGAPFPIQNLPYGVFGANRHVGVAIGDQILDLTVLEAAGLLAPAAHRVFDGGTLNPFMVLPRAVWSQTRADLAHLLDADTGTLRDDAALRARALVPQAGTAMHLPIFVRSFTDFYASREHATNVGTMFRGAENALPPNWTHIPIGYNGRASTVVVSGTPIRRPLGQLKDPREAAPRLGPCAKLDIELELGAIVGTPSAMGEPVGVDDAADMIFGYVLLNDWSARDVQVWEYQPLGPFQAKAFATSISPWVVTGDALAPFRVPTPPRDTPLLAYLDTREAENFDLALDVALAPAGAEATTISRTNHKFMAYSFAQMIAHHTISGCAMCTGDLIGSGTISGPTRDSVGSLLELSWNGRDPFAVAGGTRTFIEDGDTLILGGRAVGDYTVGFGRCVGTILPAAAV